MKKKNCKKGLVKMLFYMVVSEDPEHKKCQIKKKLNSNNNNNNSNSSSSNNNNNKLNLQKIVRISKMQINNYKRKL